MSVEVDDLVAKVSALSGVVPSVVTLLSDLAAQLRSSAGDRAKILALATEVETRKNELAKAVTDNTPAPVPGPTPPPPPEPEPTP